MPWLATSTVETKWKVSNHHLHSHNTTKTSSFGISLNKVGDKLVHLPKQKVAFIECVNGKTIPLKRNSHRDLILTEKACNRVNQLTIKVDRNCSSQCIHVNEESHQHQRNPVALVVHSKNLMGAMQPLIFLDIANNTNWFVCEEKLS